MLEATDAVEEPDVLSKVREYQDRYRSPSLARFDISGRYSLDRSEKPNDDLHWPNKYPHSDRAGVYLIFDEGMVLLYVGKASMGSCIGARLGSYFGYAPDKETCQPRHEWKKGQPRYIIAVAVPEDSPFEAPALEEFLIREYGDSLENRVGIAR